MFVGSKRTVGYFLAVFHIAAINTIQTIRFDRIVGQVPAIFNYLISQYLPIAYGIIVRTMKSSRLYRAKGRCACRRIAPLDLSFRCGFI